MPGNETSPLLENGNSNGGSQHQFANRFAHFLSTPDDEPTWLASYKFFIFGSYFNILLVFIPLSFISHWLNWDAALRFSFSFIAIMPLAKMLGDSTEQMSLKLGQTVAGLLNATFGNAVEIIVGVAALLQDELRIVQTSMLGSILSNILLVLGCSFLAGGIKYNELLFQETGAQAASSLMTLACITLVIPAAYHSFKTVDADTFDGVSGSGIQDMLRILNQDLEDGEPSAPGNGSKPGLLTISRGTAVMLLLVYVAYLVFQLKTHRQYFNAEKKGVGAGDDSESSSSECTPVLPNVQPRPSEPPKEEEERPKMNTLSAAVGLLAVTVITSFCADYLVASIEEVAQRYGIPKAFIGLVLLPIVSNAAEHVTSVWMALKNKAELTIGICVGSSIQNATFVIPLLVILGWITGHELTLFFADFETVVFFVSVILVNSLIMDGKSNYMEGILLITLYAVIALAFWVS